MGRAGGWSVRPTHRRIEAGRLWADCLAAFIEALGLPPAHVGGLSFRGDLALALFRRHPGVVRSLILMSAYAGWGGSLPAEEVQRRVELTRRNTQLPPEQWAPDLIDTLLPEGADPQLADELATMLADFHPGPAAEIRKVEGLGDEPPAGGISHSFGPLRTVR